MATHIDCAHAIRGNTCVAACDSTSEYLESQAEPTCRQCHSECANGCIGPDASDCTECRRSRLGRTCVPECPPGMVSFDSSTRVCVHCHAECARLSNGSTCTGTTPSDCMTCAHFSRSGICVRGCSISTEFVGADAECIACHSSCGEGGCTGPNSSDCVTCRLWEMPSGDCIDACPLNHFPNRASRHCESCSSLCAVGSRCPLGTGPQHCTVCNAFRHDSRCVSTCPLNTYVMTGPNTSGNDGEAQCLACHRVCDPQRGCSGPLPSDCNRCASLELVDVGTAANQTICVASCPSLHFQIGAQCRPCDRNCLHGCTGGGPMNCTATTSPSIVSANSLGCRNNAMITTGHGDVICVDDCGTRDFSDAVGICRPCSPSCGVQGCDGPLPSNCTACPTMHYLDQNSGRCQPCSTQCAVGCSGPTATDCTACAGVNVDGLCASNCEQFSNYYSATLPGHGRTCARCHPQCVAEAGCNGGTDADCTACRVFRVLPSGRCTAVCPDGTYANGTTCRSCHPACGRSCSGPLLEDCLDCQGVRLRGGQCADRCETNEAVALTGQCVCPELTAFVHNVTGACVSCHAQCTTGCTGPGPQHCIGGANACRSGIQSQSGDCVDSCPPNEIVGPNRICVCPVTAAFIADSSRCLPCSAECDRGCTGLGQGNCSGVPGACAHVFHRVTGECLSTCPATFVTAYTNGSAECVCPTDSFFYDFTSTCLHCAPACATCSGPGLSHCTACRGFNDTDGLCTAQCSNRTYVDFVNRRCLPCDSECAGSCSRPADPGACLELDGRRCRHVFDPQMGCTAACGAATPFVDVVGPGRVCRSSCPLGKPFRNDTRGVQAGELDGILCVSTCREIRGTVANFHAPQGPACSLPEVAAVDALSAPATEDNASASLPTVTIIAIVLGGLTVVMFLAWVTLSTSKRGDRDSPANHEPRSPTDAPPPSRLPAHTPAILVTRTHENPLYGMVAPARYRLDGDGDDIIETAL